jgi:hypothetical protein
MAEVGGCQPVRPHAGGSPSALAECCRCCFSLPPPGTSATRGASSRTAGTVQSGRAGGPGRGDTLLRDRLHGTRLPCCAAASLHAFSWPCPVAGRLLSGAPAAPEAYVQIWGTHFRRLPFPDAYRCSGCNCSHCITSHHITPQRNTSGSSATLPWGQARGPKGRPQPTLCVPGMMRAMLHAVKPKLQHPWGLEERASRIREQGQRTARPCQRRPRQPPASAKILGRARLILGREERGECHG